MKTTFFPAIKTVLFVTLMFISLSGNCQIEIFKSPRNYAFVNPKYARLGKDSLFEGVWKGLGIFIYPYQKVRMDVSINEPEGKIIVTDTTRRHVLYSQTASKGHFDFTTGDDYKSLILYYQTQGHYTESDLTNLSGPGAMIYFGKTEVKVSTIAIPVIPDTVNKHFVRFLHLNPPLPDVSHLTISVGKVPLIVVKPDSEPVKNLYETTILTDEVTYQAIKDFINANHDLLQSDTTGLNYTRIRGSFKIVIDYKKTYYLKYDKVKVFFRLLTAYCEKRKMDGRIINRFDGGLLF